VDEQVNSSLDRMRYELGEKQRIPLTTPTEALKIDLVFPENVRRFDWLNETLRGVPGAWAVIPTGALVLAPLAAMRSALGGHLIGSP